MVQLGKTNTLHVTRQVEFGYYLDTGDGGDDILIPNRYVPQKLFEGDAIEVFVYCDSEDRLIATTETPRVEVGQCASLRVVEHSPFGAFLDWGLSKDLLAPFKEQRVPMQEGKSYVVYVFVDATGRICASSKLDHFLSEENKGAFRMGDTVQLLIASRSDLGYKAVINGTHLGLIHEHDVLQPLQIGSRIEGYVKLIREDGLIDLTVHPKGRDAVDQLSARILAHLAEHGGESTLTDKSPPEAIYETFQASKSHYKKALGKLYKEGKLTLSPTAIRLTQE